jgi:hypothetical protein
MGHEGLAGLWLPFKDVVRAEVQALEIGEADVVVDSGKPQTFVAEMAEYRQSFFLRQSHE